MNAHELLVQIDGIGPQTADALLDHFDGDGRAVAKSACSHWGTLLDVPGISETRARNLFHAMMDADVFHDLRGY